MGRPVSNECQSCGRKKGKGECRKCRLDRYKRYTASEKGAAAVRRAAAKYRRKKKEALVDQTATQAS